MPLAIQPVTPAVAAISADLGVALQPGTVVNAQVIQVLEANLVRIAIGSLMLDATTLNPLQQGQKLQLAVGRTATAITLTPVPGEAVTVTSDAPGALEDSPLAPPLAPDTAVAKSALIPQETRVVAVAAQGAVTKQTGLSQLFANLSAVVDAGDLPKPVAAAATQLLDLRQSAQNVSGDDIKAALKSSGLMLEATMAQGTARAGPDLKSALLVLRQVLSTWLAETETAPASQAAGKPAIPTAAAPPEGEGAQLPAAPAGTPASVRAVTTEAVSTAVQALVTQAKGDTALSGNKNLLAMQMIASATGTPSDSHAEQAPQNNLPPPFRGSMPSAQAVALPSLAVDREPSSVMRQLISETEGALARQTLLQVASLPDRIDQQSLRSDPAQPRWNFEIPFATPQGTAMAHFEIARDGGSAQDYDAAQRKWQARFSLNIEPAGPIHALITYAGETTSVKMWAERPATAAQLRANVGQLGVSLDRAALKAGDIVVAEGAPAQARPPAAGHFLNRAT